MQIGRRFGKKRPRNALDDYLAEVDSYLFCVSRADRTCLHNDLKAHVRELTTDERESGRFEERYRISDRQLREEIGEPGEIARMYISSVEKRPSVGMGIFLGIVVLICSLDIYIGIDRVLINAELPGNEGIWLGGSGTSLMVIASISLVFVFLVGYRFDRFFFLSPFLVIVFIFLSTPIAIWLSRDISLLLYIQIWEDLADLIYWMLIVDFLFVAIIGLWINLNHFAVYQPKSNGIV